MKYNTRFKTLARQTISLILIVVVAITFFSVANKYIKDSQVFEIGAASGKVDLFFAPDSSSLKFADSQTIQLWATVDKPLAFINISLRYDPSLLQLTQLPTLTTTQFTKIIKQSSLTDANNTGVFTLALGLDPTQRVSAPTGTLNLATIKIKPLSTTPNQIAEIIYDTKSQVVDASAIPMTITTRSYKVTLNPTLASPSLTPSPSPTPTPIASAIPSNLPPTVAATTIRSWGRSGVKATATDQSGISLIQFQSGSTILKKCANTYTCTYYPARTTKRPFTFTISATDRSTDKLQTIITYTY